MEDTFSLLYYACLNAITSGCIIHDSVDIFLKQCARILKYLGPGNTLNISMIR